MKMEIGYVCTYSWSHAGNLIRHNGGSYFTCTSHGDVRLNDGL